ncbi:hypothetical protein [Companilactobacillus paralimentarius]|uniref:hypothetical protein n=1 Tax=Companilactobacillus paralimentarius TaxID=83526 RepID=UPI001D05205C|nr:hypothetical protein [Companilactobacillus paralimentarius]
MLELNLTMVVRIARQVDTKLKNEYKTNRTVINWFHNGQIKMHVSYLTQVG